MPPERSTGGAMPSSFVAHRTTSSVTLPNRPPSSSPFPRNGDTVTVARAATAAAPSVTAHPAATSAAASAAVRATAAAVPPQLGSSVRPQLGVHMSQRRNGGI